MGSDAIVGRDDELAVADRFLDNLSLGAGGLLLEGQAGIGKSALYRTVLTRAARRDYAVLHCAGAEAEARLSFVGLDDLVGGVLDDHGDALAPEQRDALDVALARRAPPTGSDHDPKAVGIALRRLLIAMAERRPVLIAVDDAGWLDASTIGALSFAARRIESRRVGLLVTLRLPATDIDPLGLDRAFESGPVTRLPIGPLAPAATAAMIHDAVGPRFAPPVVRRIVAASGGNPLFALDIARSLDPGRAVAAGQPLPVPDRLHGIVAARVGAVSTEARAALLAAATLTRPTVAVVEQASSEAGLAEAEEAGLVRVEQARVVFAHPLYASSVYVGAASARRRAMHGRLAALVDDREEQARHRALGAPGPDADIAAELAVVAQHARARGAADSAAELMEQAYRLSPPDSTGEREARGGMAADFHAHAGDLVRAREILEGVLAATASGATRDHGLRLLADIIYNGDNGAEAAAVLEQAAGTACDPAIAATIHLRLAFVRAHLGDLDSAVRHAQHGLDLATACHDRENGRDVMAQALAVNASIDFWLGRGIAWDVLARACELEDRVTPAPLSTRPSGMLASLLMVCGRFAETRELLASVLERELEFGGDGVDGPRVLSFAAWMEAMSGHLDLASTYIREAERRTASPGHELARAQVIMHAALVKGLRGDVDEARRDADEAIAIATERALTRPILWATTARAMLELSLGDARAAWVAVERAVEAIEASGIRDPVHASFVPEAIIALTELGDVDRADRLLGLWEERAGALDRTWALAIGARCRAVVAAARGDWAAADDALAIAMNLHRQLEVPIERGRALLVQGQLRRRQRQKTTATEALQSALHLFEQAGAVVWAQRARQELDRIGQGRRSGPLSETERQVAALVAEGRSNRQVAAALFVSPKTVEANLARVFRTLDVHSRTELAALWARQPATPNASAS